MEIRPNSICTSKIIGVSGRALRWWLVVVGNLALLRRIDVSGKAMLGILVVQRLSLLGMLILLELLMLMVRAQPMLWSLLLLGLLLKSLVLMVLVLWVMLL